MKKIIPFLLLVFVLPGCALLPAVDDQAAIVGAAMIDDYCESNDERFRQEFRLKVNKGTEGGRIVITCPDQ